MDNAKLPAYPFSQAHPEADCCVGMSKFEAFTKAAMKGLCQAAGSVIIQHGGLTQQQEDAITYAAVELARATLSELSKQQQP